MNKKILFFLLIPFLGFGQLQIGQTIYHSIIGSQNFDHYNNTQISDDGTTIAIGTPFTPPLNKGLVRVFKNISGVWTQTGQDIEGVNVNGCLGSFIAISTDGEIVALTETPLISGAVSGTVKVFKNISGVWTQIGQNILNTSIVGNGAFRVSLSSDANTVVISDPDFSLNSLGSIGRAIVFKNISGVWIQIGQEIYGDATWDRLGSTVSISSDGSVIAIGGPYNGRESVRVYKNVSNVWTQIGQGIDSQMSLNISGTTIDLSADGNILVIGASSKAGAKGKVRVYENISNVWTQIGQDIDGVANMDLTGWNVSISGDGKILAVSALTMYNTMNHYGEVRIFKNISGSWVKMGNSIKGLMKDDLFGNGVSLSEDGNTLVIDAPLDDYLFNSYGYVQVYNISGMLSNDKFVQQNFNIYPNPTSDILNISLENNFVLQEVTIYNNLGQVVKAATENVIDVSQLAKGMYFVEVTTDQGKATKKVVVN